MFITGIKTDQVDTTAQFRLGTLGMTYDGKVYKYVTYDEGTGALDLAVTADASDASGAEIGAGVVPAAVTADGSFFWIQLTGPATLAVALGGSAGDGDPLTAVGAADKALTKAAEADTAATYKSVVAIAVDADAKEIICQFPW